MQLKRDPLDGSATSVTTPPSIDQPSTSRMTWRRAIGWAAGLLLLVLVGTYIALFRPRYSTIRSQSGNAYDIIQISRDEGVGALFGRQAQAAGPALLVNYYTRLGDLQEARDVLDYAAPLADSAGLRLVVVWQTIPTLTRWVPLVHGQAWAWRRFGPGDWRVVEP